MHRAVSFLLINILSGIFFVNLSWSANMKLTSPSFGNNGYIPKKFSCHGEEISPELLIENIPGSAKTLALLVVDPDAPSGAWTHWILYNMPFLSRIPEAGAPGEMGMNSSGKASYDGPCPPSGVHHYIFKLFALDTELKFNKPPDRKAFEKAIEGHVIEEAELTGLFAHK